MRGEYAHVDVGEELAQQDDAIAFLDEAGDVSRPKAPS